MQLCEEQICFIIDVLLFWMLETLSMFGLGPDLKEMQRKNYDLMANYPRQLKSKTSLSISSLFVIT